MITFSKKMGLLLSVLCFKTAFAHQNDYVINLTVNCPLISGRHANSVTNCGYYLYGSGTEKYGHSSKKNRVFRGELPLGLNIPLNLAENGYYNDGVNYNAENGSIHCRYNNSKGFDTFSLTYIIPTATHGFVYLDESAQIKIKIPVKHQ